MPRKKACHSANLVKSLVSLIQQENITSWTEVLSTDFIKKLLGSDSRSKIGGHRYGKVENTIDRIRINISNPTCHVHAAVAAILGPKPPNPPKHSKPKDLQAEDEFEGDESESSDTSSTSSSMASERGSAEGSERGSGSSDHSGSSTDGSIDKTKDSSHSFEEKEKEEPAAKVCFLVAEEEDLVVIRRIVQKLDGKISDSKFFDPEATHLVTKAPRISERMLGAIAAGLWVVHPEYLLESHRAREFTSEEDFEWGNPKAAGFLEPQIKDDPLAQELAAACYRWRKTTADKKGAFKDFKAILLGALHNKAALERIILAGGGQVVPYDENFGGVTHCFLDVKKVNMDLSALQSSNVPCYNPRYLSYYLINKAPPE
ncbi:DNA topoisomerase 2-binding protein 1-like isoform X2 [Neocloeon triangulifer]|uniref:DNA topoisomerase 2-binding protein 1-like isoform X2 n=1 Tax=Neocloeon triangulifer TaxID=2078957 RepID=UPI00286F7857|nr:DNA topoisomerase 2-binding protein 1-like isoform X2 [Neocloeon triangulifer]